MLSEMITDIGIKTSSLLTLTRKTGGELLQINQFLSSSRREDLYRKGMRQLLPIFNPHNRNTHEVTSKLMRELMFAEEDSFDYTVSSIIYLAAVIFPAGTKISFQHASESNNTKDYSSLGPQTARISLTTQSHASAASQETLYPSEGFQTEEGVLLPFRKRRWVDFIQHGGFFVDNNTGQLKILDYKRLMSASNQDLASNQFIIEANWYMDSQSQQVVVSRSNMQIARPYNGLGAMEDSNGQSRYFVVTTHEPCYHDINLKVNGGLYARWLDPTLRQVAVLSNILANRHGFEKWVLGGLEYCGGGVVVTDKSYDNSLAGSYRFIAHRG